MHAHWQRVIEVLRKWVSSAAPITEAARDDVLAFLHLPQEHWRKVWSTNPLERLNVAPRGALCLLLHHASQQRRRHLSQQHRQWPSADCVYTRLVGSQLLEQLEEGQLERRRFFSEATMAKSPQPEEAFVFADGSAAMQAAATVD